MEVPLELWQGRGEGKEAARENMEDLMGLQKFMVLGCFEGTEVKVGQD